jgi:hypothetical protein
MAYQTARYGAGNNPVGKFLQIISWRALRLVGIFDIKPELRDACSAEEAEKYPNDFFEREYPLLDRSRQDEIKRIFSQIDEEFLSPFNAWLENLRRKMEIPAPKSSPKKLRKSPEGIEGFLKSLQKDLKKKSG